jgi:hypothetical protein
MANIRVENFRAGIKLKGLSEIISELGEFLLESNLMNNNDIIKPKQN